jgi:hypothetical protein
MNEFLNAKSMVTPGVAGGLTMLIAATLSSQFGLPAKWTGLTVSFLIGFLTALADKELSIVQRGTLCVLNSLIIFSIAVGANTVGTAATANVRTTQVYESAPAPPVEKTFFHPWFQ